MASNSESLVLLGDHVIHQLLISLAQDDILRFRDALARCLVQTSLEQERAYQPEASIVNRPEGQRILFRPFTSPTSMGTKIIATPKAIPTPDGFKTPALCGVITLCDASGRPSGILDGKAITGYRTSLSAMVPFMWRDDVSSIVVFGAGMQALWHVRLALALRGSDVKTVTIVNRSSDRAKSIVSQLLEENAEYWNSQTAIDCLDLSSDVYEDRLRTSVQDATVIFCTTPSVTPLFPAGYLADTREIGDSHHLPLITGVGSWQASMCEIHPDIIHHAMEKSSAIPFSHSNTNVQQRHSGGAVITDDRAASMMHAGEFLQAKLTESDIVEIGDLISRQESGTLSPEVQRWMSSGLLVYKSIGVSMTDLVISEMMLQLAKEKKVGKVIDGL
ncbi:hypothetical protein KC316_g1372 [Hortaea werneckii]|nr:hypothetical protein KC324_g2552 [Hortaea werneckii]KAI7594038.1 hypothetical protein KC316_g1372 [Hortaea werneckii]